MLVLYHAGGAGDFELLPGSNSLEDFQIVKHNVLRLLRARGQHSAAQRLETLPFTICEATNHFNDDFSVLHASVELTQYEELRRNKNKVWALADFEHIAEAFSELRANVRFIAVDLQLEPQRGSDDLIPSSNPGWRLSRLEVTKLVNRYIGVNAGYLGDFTRSSHRDFYLVLDLDIDPNDYEGTTRQRFITILSESLPSVQARILEGILRQYPAGSSELRTPERFSEIRSWITRLRGVPPRAPGVSEEDVSTNDPGSPGAAPSADGFRFDLGISFAGPDRDLARQIRDALKKAGFEVFFDEDYEHEMIGLDGSSYLRTVYSKQCRFCIVLISRAYDQRDWTNIEREALQSRELRGERGALIPVTTEDYHPAWLPETRIRFDLWKRSIPELVMLLTKRCTPT